jgi:hypothetical protein
VVGRLQHLVALDLSTPLLGHPSAVALAALTQLTHLCLCETEHLNYQDKYSRWPLTELVQLSQLRSLQLTGYSHPYGLLEGGVLCLPTGLQKVVLDGCGHPTVWLPHVCECPQLQHLTLSVNRQGAHVSLHPAAVVALAHKHWPHLTQLQFQGPVFRGDEDRRWTWYGDDVPVAPPVPSAWQPDVNLAGMQHLQMLHTVAYEPLAISSPDHWLLLGQLPQLHTITGARITCAPPAGLQLGALRVLSQCTVKLEGADLGRVLAACQGLTSAELVVEWVTPPPNPPSGATAAEALAAASGGSAAAAAGRGGGRAAAAAAGAVASARTSKYEQLSQVSGDLGCCIYGCCCSQMLVLCVQYACISQAPTFILLSRGCTTLLLTRGCCSPDACVCLLCMYTGHTHWLYMIACMLIDDISGACIWCLVN